MILVISYRYAQSITDILASGKLIPSYDADSLKKGQHVKLQHGATST
jgi:hypothetical protein